VAVTGTVAAGAREAVIPLTVLGADGSSIDHEPIVDTGFTGHLTLSPEEARRLGMTSLGSRYVTLGDGSMVPLAVYRATVLWDGRPRQVRAFASDGGPLIGTALLRGSRLTVDFVPGGSVVVEELA
jgi:clan AA aspartic protease